MVQAPGGFAIYAGATDAEAKPLLGTGTLDGLAEMETQSLLLQRDGHMLCNPLPTPS